MSDLGDGATQYYEPENEDEDLNNAEQIDSDVVNTDEIFKKEEIFAGLNAPFEIRATLQVINPKTNKPVLKTGRMILRIPHGLEMGAIFKRAKKLSHVDLQNELAHRVFVQPKFTFQEIQRLPSTFKVKILDIVTERSGGTTISDLNQKEVNDFL